MDYFEKKQWIRIAVCAVIVAVITLALTGVFGNGSQLVYPLPSQDASVKGFGGDVTAHVRLNDDGTVRTLTVDTPDETEGLGKRASEAEFIEQFIGKAAPFAFGENGIEALSGATVTSAAALKAINWAATGEEPAPEKTAEPQAADADALTATEQGFGGNVTVHVTMDGERILALTVETPDETEGLGKRASEAEFTEQFIGKAGPFVFGENGIEALSGATVTSTAALTAINKTISGVAEATAEEPAEKAEEPKEENKPEEPAAAEKKEEPAAESKPEKKADTAASDGQVYGSYRVTKENSFSRVTVTVGTKNGAMTSCNISSEGEQDLLTDEIRDAWAKAILESGSAAPDAITGATLKVSAQSVQEAMTDILAQMGGGTAAPTEEAAKTEEPAEVPKEEKADTAASDGQVYGSYRVTKENSFSKVTVTVGTKNGAMTSCKIASEGEQDLLTDEIRDAWAKAILESGSAAPDAITGATLKVSAQSVQEAMTDILAQMSGEAAAPAETEEKVEAMAEEKAGTEPETPAAEPAEAPAGEPAEEPAEKPAEVKEEAGAERVVPAYAGYRTDRENEFSKVTVIAAAKSGKLTSVKILSSGEQDLLTDEIRGTWAKAILESGSAAPDTITGATLKVSAQSVQEAMTDILAQMGGEAGSPAETEEKTEVTAEEKAGTEPETPAAEPAEVPAEAPAGEPAEEPAEKPEEVKEEAGAERVVPAYAGYRADRENEFSKVTVIAAAKSGKLTSVKILSSGEQDLLTDEIRGTWAKAILESGSAAPDAITGATLKVSAQSVQEAMTDILAQMGGEAAASAETEEKAEATAEEKARTEPETPAAEPAEVPAGESAKEPAEKPAEVKEEAGAERVVPAYAGYRADRENEFSKVTVIAAAKSGKLTSVKILSSGEQDLLTDEIRGTWAKAILESGSAAPDAITGATLKISARSVQEAAEEILATIAGE